VSVGVIAIVGPTASGKSRVALRLAEAIGGEIVNADAMQCYAGLPILTNKPSRSEIERVAHHLIGVWPISADGDVAGYQQEAHRVIDAILARGRVPIIVGGTGLYLRAAVASLALPPRPPAGMRERITAEYLRDGAVATHARLAARDPRAAERVHPNDRRRVVRALELVELGATLAPETDALWTTETRHPTRLIGLVVERAQLHERIAARTAAMFERGVVAEVAAILADHSPSLTASRTLGLDELRGVVDGVRSINDAHHHLLVRTRQYARRQQVWMRRMPGIELVAPDEVTPSPPARTAATG
jgi:tRNA dimethylallyltransferase